METDKYDEWVVEIGLKIAYYRRLRRMTQSQLAELVGISTGYLAQVEAPSCVQPISLHTLFRLADQLNIKPMVLLDFEER